MNATAPTFSTDARRTYVPYSSYGKSGLEWLPKIPATWKTTRNAFLFRQRDERNFPDLPLLEVSINSGVTLRDFSDDHIEQQAEDPSTYKRARRGDLVFNKMRMWQGAVGVATTDGLVSPDYIVAVPFHEVDARYFEHLFRTTYYLTEINKYSRGIVKDRNRLYWDDFKQIVSVQPPLHEQLSIVRFIGRMTAKIDALVAKKQRLIELLQEKRTALISHAVTKGLDRGVPMKESSLSVLGKIPAHWDTKPLKYLTPDNRQIMYGIILPGPNVENGVPIVKGGDVTPGRLSLDRLSRTTHEIESNYVKSRLGGGDIVYAIRGSIGMAEIVPSELENANLTQDAARVSPRTGLNNRWLLYALKSRPIFSQLDASATGATIRGINIRDLKRALVPVPPKIEQDSISAYLDREAAKFDQLIERVQVGIRQVREYRTVLISAAVTGKIDVRGEAE